MPQDNLQLFGGDWTETKLAVLRKYLNAYLQALKKTLSFHKAYVDAFAGTGYRERRVDTHETGLVFEDAEEPELQKFLDGSPKIALQTEIAFDKYFFVELDRTKAQELEKLKLEFSERASSMEVRVGDANEELQKVCKSVNWKSWRAVFFLDPFGMQIDWATIQAIASTRAIDMWVLFPLMAVNRLLTRDQAKMQQGWGDRLTRIFGTVDWRGKTLRVARELQDIFGQVESKTEKTCSPEMIGAYYRERLETIFPTVAKNPRLCGDRTTPRSFSYISLLVIRKAAR